MGALEDTRKVLQDFIAPELREIQERLDGIDKRFDALDRKMAKDKSELLRTMDFMLKELRLRIELASLKTRVEASA
jgi:hypothetical protein